MAKAFDCATPLTYTKAKQFFDQGYGAVGRYLAPTGSSKRLSRQEAQAITDAGLYIVSAFERGADRAAQGARAGREDGMLALRYAQEVGQPEGSAIYPAVDFDANPSHYDPVEAYLRAFDEQIPGYECGVYGEYEICKELLQRGVVTKIWQTYAWSGGKKVDDPNFYQYDNGPTGSGKPENGINVDLDVSNGDAGGWQIGMAIMKTSLDQEVAKAVLDSYLKPDYASKEAAAAACREAGDDAGAEENEKIMKYIGTLGAGIKQASGLPEDY